MDIKARIEKVIEEKGLSKRLVAERMGKFSQAFNSLLTNPKWETIELVASAIGISTCEMLFGIKQESQPETAQHTTSSPVEELPFENKNEAVNEQTHTTLVGMVRCPQCGRAIRLFAEE